MPGRCCRGAKACRGSSGDRHSCQGVRSGKALPALRRRAHPVGPDADGAQRLELFGLWGRRGLAAAAGRSPACLATTARSL